MKFYNLTKREYVEIPDKDVKYEQVKNGRWMVVGTHEGMKLRKFVSPSSVPQQKTTSAKNNADADA